MALLACALIGACKGLLMLPVLPLGERPPVGPLASGQPFCTGGLRALGAGEKSWGADERPPDSPGSSMRPASAAVSVIVALFGFRSGDTFAALLRRKGGSQDRAVSRVEGARL